MDYCPWLPASIAAVIVAKRKWIDRMFALVVLIALPFVWCGMVVAISFVETPLKFKAPGITRELGVGIGRLVFRALNLIEEVLAVAIIIAWIFAAQSVPPVPGALLILSMVALAAQVLVLRPGMSARARALAGSEAVDDGGPPVGGHVTGSMHVAYIVTEVVKAVALPIAGAGIVMNVISLGS